MLPPQESTPPRVDAPSTPSLEQLSLADECGAWPGLKVAPDEVTPLPSDFAAGQLDPDNLFDPEIGAQRLTMYPAAAKAACASRLTQAWCYAVTESWINVSTNPPALPDIEKFEVRWNSICNRRCHAVCLTAVASPAPQLQALERTRAALPSLSAPAPRLAAMRATLESLIVHRAFPAHAAFAT